MAKSEKTGEHVYLVDGSGFIFRAFHALPPLTRPDGTPVNAVLGFANMMLKLIDEFQATHLAVIFDAGRKTFRNTIYEAYKANRAETPAELIPQFSLIREACQAFQIQAVELEGYEADDLIATYARLAEARGMGVTIVSSDKDLMQLIRPTVHMYDPVKNKSIGPDEVFEKFGVTPDKVCDIQAMAGDSSDNIPGIPGVGPKTAAELIHAYGDLEGVLANAHAVKQPKRRQLLLDYAENARLSLRLVTLDPHVPVTLSLDTFRVSSPSIDPLVHFLKAQNFSSLLSRIHKKRQREPQVSYSLFADLDPPSPSTPRAVPEIERGGDHDHLETAEDLSDWIETYGKLKGQMSIDAAFLGRGVQATLRSVAFAVQERSAFWILGERSGEEAMVAFKRAMADDGLLKIGHNLKPLATHLVAGHNARGHPLGPLDDVLLLSYVLNNGRHKHDLATLAHAYGIEADGAYDDVNTAMLSVGVLAQRQVKRAKLTWLLQELLRRELMQQRLTSVYETYERPLVSVIAKMEAAGIMIDPRQLQELSVELSAQLETLEKEIYGLANRSFNIGSPKQLGEVLFDELKLSGGKRGVKTGAYVTDAQTLEGLSAEGHLLPEKVLQWRQIAKLKGTYTDALLEQMDPQTHRIHTTFAMTTTSTGRLSSLDPNLQNIPVRTQEGRKIRKAFIAPKGKLLVSFDYSQIELRLLAHVAGVKELQEAFHQGADIHQLTASQVFGVPLGQVSSELRRRAKAINFGIIYGISAFGLAKQINEPARVAGDYIKRYFHQYPGIREYMDTTIAAARSAGYVCTPWGRRCHIQGLTDSNFARRQFAERQAINAPLQGGAADIIKKAMAIIDRRSDLEGTLLLQVHDELLFEVQKEKAEGIMETVRSMMENVVTLSVPLRVDTTVGPNWMC